jgi:hypothetical protein
VLGNLLPIYVGLHCSKLFDFVKLETTGIIRRIAETRHSAEPHPVLQPGFLFNENLNELAGSQSLAIASHVRKPC